MNNLENAAGLKLSVQIFQSSEKATGLKLREHPINTELLFWYLNQCFALQTIQLSDSYLPFEYRTSQKFRSRPKLLFTSKML
jgi:hypothetical protein